MIVTSATDADTELTKSVLTKSVRTESEIETETAGVEIKTDFTKITKVKGKNEIGIEIEIEKEEEKVK